MYLSARPSVLLFEQTEPLTVIIMVTQIPRGSQFICPQSNYTTLTVLNINTLNTVKKNIISKIKKYNKIHASVFK